MKKREKKMQLHRETLTRLSGRELAEAQGGALAADNVVRYTSCIEPNCCGDLYGTQ